MLGKGFHGGIAEQLLQSDVIDRAVEHLTHGQQPQLRGLNSLGDGVGAKADPEVVGDELGNQVGHAGLTQHIGDNVPALKEGGNLSVKSGGSGGHDDGLMAQVFDGENIPLGQRILRGDQGHIVVLLDFLIIELFFASGQLVLFTDHKRGVERAVEELLEQG